MDFFANIEKSLENIIETALMDNFGGRVQPIEIARALWREMTANKRVSINDTYVPNYFLVTLSPADYSFLESVRHTVENEILQYLQHESEKRDFKRLGNIAIHWVKDDTAKEGRFYVSSDFLKNKEIPPELKKTAGSDDSADHDTTLRLSKKENEGEKPKETTAALEVKEGFDRGARFELVETTYLIGRSVECDITIGDPRVSKRHCKIHRENDRFILEDMESRSGTFINGEKIEKHVLNEPCEIHIGMTKMEFQW